MEKLVSKLNQICDEQPYVTGWYVKNLINGAEAARNGDVPFPSGSTRKTSILAAVLRAVNQGRLSLDEPILYEERLREGVVSGTFKFLTPGFTITLRDALVQMIIVSDNVCTRMVMERITLAEINEFCQSIGMRDTRHRTSVPDPGMAADHPIDAVTTVTARDQGLLYDLLLQGTHDDGAARLLGCTSAQCAFAIDVLSWQKLRTKIASLLPADTRIAHKGGTGKRGRMDGGIVFRDGRPLFIITVYTDQVPRDMPDGMPGYVSAFNTMGRLARACWDIIGTGKETA